REVEGEIVETMRERGKCQRLYLSGPHRSARPAAIVPQAALCRVPCPRLLSLLDLPLKLLSLMLCGVKSKGLSQAYVLQDFTFACALALKDSLTKEGKLKLTREEAVAVSRLVDAWSTCQERIRIHRGKPLPGSLRPKPE